MRYLTLLLIISIAGCSDAGVSMIPSIEGFAPVCEQPEIIKKITTGGARNTTLPGKIYAYKNYIFQNDINSGIHIIDNSNPAQPKKVGYIDIPLSTEVAVKGDYLYSNNLDDLVVFDISKPSEAKFVKRVENVFPPVNQHYPPANNAYFECADEDRGIVVRWEKKMLKEPKCHR